MGYLGFALGMLILGLVTAGCVSSPFGLQYVDGQKKAGLRLPEGYQPLKVPNACFVESLQFYDAYRTQGWGGSQPWARILHWCDRKDDYTLLPGHAVAVFAVRGTLWLYDVNFGLLPARTPFARRTLEQEILPEITVKYPHLRPVAVRFGDDLPRDETKVDYPVDAKVTGDNRELAAVRAVATALGRTRPVRVMVFHVSPASDARVGAAAVFRYGAYLCVYVPDFGTQVQPSPLAGLEATPYVSATVRTLYPQATRFRWVALN